MFFSCFLIFLLSFCTKNMCCVTGDSILFLFDYAAIIRESYDYIALRIIQGIYCDEPMIRAQLTRKNYFKMVTKYSTKRLQIQPVSRELRIII